MSALDLDDRGIILSCPSCGQKNRLAFERLDDPVRCGQCKHELSVPLAPVEIQSSHDFETLIAHASIPVVVD